MAKNYTKEQLESMTVVELRELADKEDIDLSEAHRKDEIVDALYEALGSEPDTDMEPPSKALPIGLKENAAAEEPTDEDKEEKLKAGWEKRAEPGLEPRYISRGEFKVPGSIVPAGVSRTLDEAYALEEKRLG